MSSGISRVCSITSASPLSLVALTKYKFLSTQHSDDTLIDILSTLVILSIIKIAAI